MTAAEALIFRLLDDHVRTRHACFVSEFFPTRENTKYSVCFRPLKAPEDSPERYACRYLQVGMEEADQVAGSGALTGPLREQIDRELSLLVGEP